MNPVKLLSPSVALCALLSSPFAAAAMVNPGAPRFSNAGNIYSLSNRVIEAKSWIADGALGAFTVTGRLHREQVSMLVPFALLLDNSQVYGYSDLQGDDTPHFSAFAPQPNASRYSDRQPGKESELSHSDQAGDIKSTWNVVSRDGSDYTRLVVAVTAVGRGLPISTVRLIDAQLPNAQVVGSVKGSSIIAGIFTNCIFQMTCFVGVIAKMS